MLKEIVNQVSRGDQNFVEFRLHQLADRVVTDSTMALLVLSGLSYIFRVYLDYWLVAGVAAVACGYVLRMLLAQIFLNRQPDCTSMNWWSTAFTGISILNGISWGFVAAILILLDIPDADLFLIFMVSGLTAMSIPTLGILPMAYASYVIGMLVPVAAAIVVKDINIDPVLTVLAIAYAVFLGVTARGIHNNLNTLFRLNTENEELVHKLIDANQMANKAWSKLTMVLTNRQKAELGADKHPKMYENILDNIPGMAYRALNDGQWTFKFVSNGCRDLLGLSAIELKAQGKNSLKDILVGSDNAFPFSSSRLSDSPNSFKLEYNLITADGSKRRVIERGSKIFDESGALVAIDGFISAVFDYPLLATDIEHLPQALTR